MSEWTREALVQRVFEIVRDELLTVGDDFTPRSNLIEAGLDSMAVTQLALSIEESTGVWLDESMMTPEVLESSETVAACVHAQLNGE